MAQIKTIYGNEVIDDALRGSVADEYSSSSTYAVGDMVLKDGQLYECTTAISTAEAWTAAHWTAVTVGGELATVKDGLKEDGVAASAEQLLSDKYTVDQVPYHYRASGGNGADREYDEIVGGSVVWNQLANPGSYTEVGITGTTTNGVITINGTTTGAGYYSMGATFTISDHVYLIDRKQNTQLDGVTFYNDGKGILLNYNVDSSVQKANGAGRFYIRIASGVTFNNYQTTPQIFDLTAMFGSTIADYIYSLEQSSAGVGVALFRTLFPGVYAYDAGTMRHVSGLQSHDTVGFNAWDEEWEAGVYTVAGNKGGSASSNAIRCKEPIKVFPNAEYSIYLGDSGTQYRLHFLDESKNVISMINYRAVLKWTTPQNCHYILFCTLGDTAPVYGNTYKNDICINLSDPSRNGEYEPYVKHSYPLDSSLTLRGVPKLADGKIYYDGDTYAADGTVTRKYGIVDLGTLTWYYNTAEGYAKRFYTENIKSLVKYETNNTLPHAICKYNGMSANDLQNVSASKDRAFAINYVGNLYIRDDAYTDTATFKAAMSGVYLVYELATPTTETAEPFINPQKVDPYGTEEYVSTSLVPVGHYTKYPENLRAKLENLDLSMIAPIETGTTASQAYAVGKYFLLNNKFCKAKTAIASGATFTLGTNYEVTTVADELYTALNA